MVDEFYKLSLKRDDDRALALNHAFYKLLKKTDRFYLLGPVIKSIPATLSSRLIFKWVHTNYATVAVNEIDVLEAFDAEKERKEEILFEQLNSLRAGTIIYCSSPKKATDLPGAFLKFLEAKNEADQYKTSENNDIIEWLEQDVHSMWVMNKLLQYSIAFHHGAIPRHLGSSLVDAFNEGKVKYLFCTSTLIEGVNTVAKNIVLFDQRKGMKPIDYFDYKNIAGRSGRMKVHYVGNVFRFNPEPDPIELEVDIPIITQDNAPPELLIQIERDELVEESKEKIHTFSSLEEGFQNVVKENSGLSIDGQIAIANRIEENLDHYSETISWTGLPRYQELLEVIRLAWDHLLKQNESRAGIRSPEHLATVTLQFSILKSLAALIQEQIEGDFWKRREPNEEDRINIVVYNVFNYARHWFDYKLTKWLQAISKIQAYVFEKNNLPAGDYSVLAAVIENSFLPTSLAILLEYDIPISAIKKIETYVPSDITPDNVLIELRKLPWNRIKLLAYERNKLDSIL